MNEYPRPTDSGHKEFAIEGKGYRINHLEAVSSSPFVIITLPGFGGSATAEYEHLTAGNDERPHGLAVSYLREFDLEALTAGLIDEMRALAANGHVDVILHACSYGASILPPLIAQLKGIERVHIQGILVRSPLYDRTCFTDKFLKADEDTLERVFDIALSKQATKEKRNIPPDEAKAEDLLAKLPSAMDGDYAQTLQDNEIPLTTISFTGDRVINNGRVQGLLRDYGNSIPLESSKDFMGHYPKDVDEMRSHEGGWVWGHMSTG